MKSLAALSLLLLTFAAVPAWAAPEVYVFDSVTAVEMHSSHPNITGFAKDTHAPLVVTFVDQTNVSFRYVVSRCLPLFVTAMEKPGRYFLYVTVDPAEFNVGLKSCRLELKP